MKTFNPSADKIIHETSVDFKKRIINDRIHLVQYDNSLPILSVSLYSDSNAYEIPSLAFVNLRLKKPDGTFVLSEALGCNSEKNKVYFEISQQMTACFGFAESVVEVIIGDSVAASGRIEFEIDKNPIQDGDIQSSDDYEALKTYPGAIRPGDLTIIYTPTGSRDQETFRLMRGSQIQFHGFDSKLIDEDHLSIEGTRLQAEGYSNFKSGDITFKGDETILISQDGQTLAFHAIIPDVSVFAKKTEVQEVQQSIKNALQPKDVKIRTEDFCRYTEKVRKSILKPTEGMKAGKETTIEIYDEIESENEIEFPSDKLPNISFDGRRIEGNYSGDDGKIEWNIIPIYNEAGKYVIQVFAVITWNSDTSSGVIEVPYDEVSTHDVSGGNFEFPLEKGSIITFHGFKNELESDKHLVIEGTRIRAEGYTDFASGYVTLVAGKNIGIAQEGNKFTIIGADIPDVPKNVVTTDTEQLISGEKTFTSPVKIDGDGAYLTVGSVDNGYISIDNKHIIKGDSERRQSFVLNIQDKSGTIALTSDIPDISGLAEKTEVEAVKKTAETAQSTANSAKTAAQTAQNSANASLQPEDVTIIAEQDSGNLNLPLKKGTRIFLHGFSADLVSDNALSIDGTRLKASETSQDPISGDITLKGDGIIRISQVAKEFVFSAYLPENHVTTDTEQTITSRKTFSEPLTVGDYDSNAIVIDSTGIQVCSDGTCSYLTLPKKFGTVATLEDIPQNHVTTDTAQEILGAKTFKGNVTFGDFTSRGLGVNSRGLGFTVYVDSVGYPVTFQAKSGTVALTDDIDTKISGLVNSAPETLDTLEELAKALGDDPNFATTVSTELGKRALKTDLSNYLPLSGGTLTDKAQIWRNGNNVPWANGREAAVLRIGSTGEWTHAGGSQYCPIFSVKSENGSWDFGSYNDEAHLLYIKDSDYDGGNHVRTADYKFPKNKSGTVALEEETVNPDDIQIHVNNPDESFMTNLRDRVNLEFHGFDFDHEEGVLTDGKKFQRVTIDGTRITANGAPDGFISGDITFKGIGITIAQAAKEITFGAVAPTWSQIDGIPDWIGSSKPSYTWSEIGSKPSWIGSSKPSYAWSEVTGKPTNFVTTDTEQEISGEKTFASALTTFGSSKASIGIYPENTSITVSKLVGANPQLAELQLPFKFGTIALTDDIPTDKDIFLKAHPVGSIYMSFEKTSPKDLFGGSWTAITGRFLYCNAGTGIGGSNSVTLSVDQIPSHSHWFDQSKLASLDFARTGYGALMNGDANNSTGEGYGRPIWNQPVLNYTGGGQPFNNMPAYQEVYAWRRTA